MIKNLIFDFGKVLVDYDFEGFFLQRIPDAKKRMAFSTLVNNKEMMEQYDREVKPFEEIMEDVIAQNRDLEREIRIFTNQFPDIVTGEIPGMRDLLTRLKAEGYKLYGLTNWCSKVHVTIAQYDIFRLLDGMVISSEEHLVKPEAAIYQRLFDRFGLKPEECLFADDREENIEGGRAVGMDGIVFRDARQYEQELMVKVKK